MWFSRAFDRWVLRQKYLPSSMWFRSMVLLNANIWKELIKNSTCSIHHAMIKIGRYLSGECYSSNSLNPSFIYPSYCLQKEFELECNCYEKGTKENTFDMH